MPVLLVFYCSSRNGQTAQPTETLGVKALNIPRYYQNITFLKAFFLNEEITFEIKMLD
jgi:hypothetical protein